MAVDDTGPDWGANCGPYTLAAVAGLTLAEVQPLVSDPVDQADLFSGGAWSFRGYMSPEHMFKALVKAGVKVRHRDSRHRPLDDQLTAGLHVVQIAFSGPWPAWTDIHRSHWIAVRLVPGLTEVYDPQVNTWMDRVRWRDDVLVPFAPKNAERCYMMWRAEIDR